MRMRILTLAVLGALPLAACADNDALTSPVAEGLTLSLGAVAYDCSTHQSQIPQTECEALVALYNSTGGPAWSTNTDWLVTDKPCSWYGVGCSAGSVSRLDLPSNNLTGTLPAALGNLSNLVALWLHWNQLTGSIPAELGNPTNLRGLGIAFNQLSGALPAELGNLSNLEDLGLQSNQLSGPIPPELGNLSNLEGLSLYSNQLSGPIPAELGNLSRMERLLLGSNQLSGPIPAELGNLSSLWGLELYRNQLSGPIPAELGNLSNLEGLWLIENQLSGPIPAELGDLSNLEALALHDNQLSGPIPAELGNLSNLVRLDLRTNQLSGPIPAALGNLSNLEVLALGYNQLGGLVPIKVATLGGSAPLSNNCQFVPGNTGLYMPDTQSYRDADQDGDRSICGLALSYFVVVDIDIKPGGDPNSINCTVPKQIVPVAILTTADFDATAVDHATVTFEGASETHVQNRTGEPQRHEEDVDGDGDIDLLLHFRLGDTYLTCTSAEGVVTGGTFDGMPITGTDAGRGVQ
jgi:hypothetical protein